MKTTNYNIRLNPVIKDKAEKTFAEFGLNLSEAINVFLHMSIKCRGFPFEIREPSPDSPEMLAFIKLEDEEIEANGEYDGDILKEAGQDSALKSAIEIAIDTGKISTSLLQTKLSLGYARAARIIDAMEKMNIIGPFGGATPRKILITRDEFNKIYK